MASGTKTKAKKHKCSCGRSFRHAISLKRHQNVTGCEPATEEAVADAVEEAATPTKKSKSKSKPKSRKSDAKTVAPAPSQDDRTIVITPELVAAWQEQTGFNRRHGNVVDTIPTPAKPQVDWVALAKTGQDFVEFCGEVKTSTFKGVKSLLVALSRAALLCGVIALTGWCLVSGVSASVSSDYSYDAGRTQLAAQTLVQDFLQNAKLNQYDRARNLLAPGARETVSKIQLQTMFNSLPLNHTPTAWNTELSSDGRTARVIVARDGLNEVYTVVRSDKGWGLASVSIANS